MMVLVQLGNVIPNISKVFAKKTRKLRRNVDVGINAGDDVVGGKEQRNDEPHLARHRWEDDGVFMSPQRIVILVHVYIYMSQCDSHTNTKE